MSNKAGLTLFAAGLLAATVGFAPYAPSAAQERPAISTDFSAQQQQENKGQQKKAAPAARPAPQRAAPQRAAPQRAAPQRAAPQRRLHKSSSAARGYALSLSRRRAPRMQSSNRKPHRAQSRSRKPRHVRSGNRRPLRKRSLRLPVVAKRYRPLPLRGSSHHAAPEPSLHRACAGCRRAAPAALSSAAKITRRGVADTAYVMAAAGGRLSHSAPWAPSQSARINTIPTPTFRRPSRIVKG